MFQQGTQAAVNAEAHATVLFGRSFKTTPAVVHAWVENLVDDPIMEIEATVVDKTKDGFSVALDPAPPSGNYTIQWFAGDAQDIYQILLQGRKTSEHPLFSGDLADNDFVLLTRVSPTLETVRVRVSALKAMFPNLVDVPATPASFGLAGQVAINGAHIFTHDGFLWGRSDRDTTW